jgi:hypothetical protein
VKHLNKDSPPPLPPSLPPGRRRKKALLHVREISIILEKYVHSIFWEQQSSYSGEKFHQPETILDENT